MNLQDFFDIVEYKISEGTPYLWKCFGDNAYILTSNNDNDSAFEVCFDTKTQVVYEMEAYDFVNDRSYRWLNPDFKEALENEASSRGIEPRTSYDDVKFIDIEVEYDFLEKAKAIFNNEPYDTRIVIELDFSPEEIEILANLAEQKGVTVDKLVEQALIEQMALSEAKNAKDTWEFS